VQAGAVLAARNRQRLHTALQGLVVGLAASRLLAERSGLAFFSLGWLSALAAGLVLGGACVWLLRRWQLDSVSLWVLLPGVLWPWSISLLWGLSLMAGLMVLLMNLRRRVEGPWVEVMVLLGFLALYVTTLAPTVLPADSGEFQLVTSVLGIAHPPGYALYTILGWLFAQLPIGDVAYRLNLFGAACGVLTLVIMVRTVRRVSGSAALALVAAGMLGLSATFWAQSTTANIRSLTALFTALCVDLLLRWQEKRSAGSLAAFGFCFGLGVGHHASLILLGLPFLAFIVLSAPRLLLKPRQWAPALLALMASFLVLLYLPLRSLSGAPFDPSPIRSWSDFVSHVLAQGFRGDMLYFRDIAVLMTRAGIWGNIVRLQFGPILPWLTGLAAILLAARQWRLAVLLLGVCIVNVLAALTYRAPQTVEYLIPSYVAMALTLAMGLGQARLRHPWRDIVVAWLAIVVLVNGLRSYPSFQLLHRDESARVYAERILADAPTNALVLSSWHRATPFWYLQHVEGLRPDVTVQYVYPEGSLPNEQVWLRRIAEAVGEQPVIVTNWFYAFEGTDYTWAPFHDAWLVRGDPVEEPPEEIVTSKAAFDGEIEVLGYVLDTPVVTPGASVGLRVYWRPLRGLAHDYASFVQLLGPAGVLGQGDLGHASRDYLPGQVRVDAYHFPLLLQTPPGQYQLITGFYYAHNGGWQRLGTAQGDHLALATLEVQAMERPPATSHPLSMRLESGPELAGIDYDRTVPGQTRVYLHWRRGRSVRQNRGETDTRQGRVQLAEGQRILAEAAMPGLAPGSGATVVVDVGAEVRQLEVGVLDEAGNPWPWAGPWCWPAATRRLPPIPDESAYVPLGGEMAFVGLQDQPERLSAGEKVLASPRFLSLRPLLDDYAISVGLRHEEAGWETKSDSVPALGAIPTLKWLSGWMVTDPHALTAPLEATRGRASITLSVYDTFTLRSLNVLDDRLAQQGQGTYLRIGGAPIE